MPVSALLPGESIELDGPGETQISVTSDKDIADRYMRGEVRIVTDQARTQLAELPLVLDSGRYKLQPEYQRRHRWTPAKKSRLIESFIMNVPVPPIFVYEYEYSKYEVMDGLQRLSTVWDFYREKFELVDLEYWPELNGRTYSTLPLQLRQAIDRRYMSSIILLYETSDDAVKAQQLKELVFERINSGGVALSEQETRNALSTGPLNALLPELARIPEFCRTWGIPEPEPGVDDLERPEVLNDARFQSMDDVEIVLRFFAHRQRDVAGAPRRLKPFLDKYWQRANKQLSEAVVNGIAEIFEETIKLVYAVFGETAFYIRRERNGKREWVPRPTLLAYDSVMSAFSQRLAHGELFIDRKDEVRKSLEELYDLHSPAFDGRKTDPKDILHRDELILGALDSMISRSLG
jgi:hypothetical protein